jgi:hypothetical protein
MGRALDGQFVLDDEAAKQQESPRQQRVGYDDAELN